MRFRKLILWLMVPLLMLGGAVVWVVIGGISNPRNRKTIGEIATPVGFQRVEVEPGSFGAFLRAFPLQPRGSKVREFDGTPSFLGVFGYAILDLPMISENEQCCDAVQRMRSEYLFSKGRYSDIHFKAFDGKTMRYQGENNKQALYKYLQNVFVRSNTSTLRHELPEKPWDSLEPGDVLVYEASSPTGSGHAVLVVDVAKNPRNGRTAIMVAQSSMPAVTMHIARPVLILLHSPWIIIEHDDNSLYSTLVLFFKSDLRGWD